MRFDFSNKKVLITFGSTREPIDSVRYIGNSSSGKMGYSLAKELINRQAIVSVVHGHLGIDIDEKMFSECVSVSASQQMYEQTERRFSDAGVLVMVAAVSDYVPANKVIGKIKKHDSAFHISLKPSIDILKTLSHKKRKEQITIGFALEDSADAEARALKKLQEKKLNAIVLNNLHSPEVQLGHNDNKVSIFFENNNEIRHLPLMHKDNVATKILDSLEELL